MVLLKIQICRYLTPHSNFNIAAISGQIHSRYCINHEKMTLLLNPFCINAPFYSNAFKYFECIETMRKNCMNCLTHTQNMNYCVNQFVPNASFLYPLKTSKNRFSDVFSGRERVHWEQRG